ncbi:Mediator of RNA polymerase II transcription subunit 8 [Neolecta irregularis DAH-3]|uniref:Mediator of RNA polymerase II transcription subunit 8 n=1 Tax=Neolecta irregularis (strain DAH-3) TaxID=1198029 RepID=A0A1U7LLR2_NEOID|nr:Mediator of RNA polymerase II transcription subunit 8 [Neolecta irregularis DAH-3]|eukprot:OLL23579.1 Mediator of RNA polymerase II transcription subunit 8 [Neolecta irregularis DAH-3]
MHQTHSHHGKTTAQIMGLQDRPTLHSTFTILLAQLDSIMKSLSLVASRFRETVVFPEGNFPARAEENLLTTLLRKKVDPSVEEWETEALVNDPAENDDEFREWAAGVTVQAREGKMIGGLAKSETLEQQQIHQTAVDNVLTFMTKGVS